MDRKKHILKKIQVDRALGLELGPLHDPIITKEEGRVFYVDHMSTEDLRKKYAGHPFDLDRIVGTDFVLSGNKTLKEAVKNNKYDYVVASHVIEHIPNMIAWLNDVSSVLKPGGILSLAIPDMRFTFDIGRGLSRVSEVIGSYLDGVSKSTSSMIYDSISEAKEITPQSAWAGDVRKVLNGPTLEQIEKAWEMTLLNQKPDEYVDAHCYTFTPASFLDIIKRLMLHGLIDFEIAYFKETGHDELEFFVSLRKIKGKKNIKAQLSTVPKIRRQRSFVDMLTHINDLEKQLEMMQNSKSWMITQPLRKVNALIRKMRRA